MRGFLRGVAALAVLVGLAVGTFVAVRHWQATRPPERVAGTGMPLSASPSPQCPAGVVTTSVPVAAESSRGLDGVALGWVDTSGVRGLKTYQVTLDALPEASASQASVAFADVTRTIVARITLQRAPRGGGWVLERVERCE